MFILFFVNGSMHDYSLPSRDKWNTERIRYVFENALKDALDVLHRHCFLTEVFYELFKSCSISEVIENFQVQFSQATSVFFLILSSIKESMEINIFFDFWYSRDLHVFGG